MALHIPKFLRDLLGDVAKDIESIRNAANQGVTFIVTGPKVTASDPPAPGPTTQARVSWLTGLGVPQDNILWNVVGEEAAGGGGTFAVGSLTITPAIDNIVLVSAGGGGTFAVNSLTITPVIDNITMTLGGGALSVSDNFNRPGPGLGANWTTVPGLSAPTIEASAHIAAALSGAYWSANAFANNQWSKATIYVVTDAYAALVTVRQSPSANTCYWATVWDDTSGSGHNYFAIYKRVAGVDTQMGGFENADAYGGSMDIELEASGTVSSTTLTLKANGTTITTRTDTVDVIASGSAGFDSNNAMLDNWSGGDL